MKLIIVTIKLSSLSDDLQFFIYIYTRSLLRLTSYMYVKNIVYINSIQPLYISSFVFLYLLCYLTLVEFFHNAVTAPSHLETLLPCDDIPRRWGGTGRMIVRRNTIHMMPMHYGSSLCTRKETSSSNPGRHPNRCIRRSVLSHPDSYGQCPSPDMGTQS